MKITFNVTTEGKSTEVTTSYADVMALEEKYNIDASELATRQRASWLAFLAWSALKRTKQIDTPFEEWRDTLEGLEPKDDSGND